MALSALLLGGFAVLVVSDLATPVRVVTTPGQIDSAPLAEPSPQVAAPTSEDSLAPTRPEPTESANPAPAAPAPGPAAVVARESAREQGVEKPDTAKRSDREEAPAATGPARTRRSSAERRKAAQAAESEQAPLPSLTAPSGPVWSAPTRTTDQPEWLKRTPSSEGASKGPGVQLPDNPY
jgi:hypothetical protein